MRLRSEQKRLYTNMHFKNEITHVFFLGNGSSKTGLLGEILLPPIFSASNQKRIINIFGWSYNFHQTERHFWRHKVCNLV